MIEENKINFANKAKKKILCLVTDRRNFSIQELLNKIEQAILGGVNMVQLRDKFSNDDDVQMLAQKILSITKEHNIPLIINDRVRVARNLKLGLHFGKNDYNSEYKEEIEKFLHEKSYTQIAGYTVDSLAENIHIPPNIDYLGIGPIWASKTKIDTQKLGLDGLKILQKRFENYPIIAIGGIVLENVNELLKENVSGIALIGSLLDANDIYLAAQSFSQVINFYDE